MPPRSPFRSRLDEAVTTIREERSTTHAQTAKLMGVPASFLSDIERGVRNGSLFMLQSFSGALKVKLPGLLKRAGN